MRTALDAMIGDEFERIRLLGEGQFARVYLARERSLRRLVAIKELRPELAQDAELRGRFLREARSAARIEHPNVASIYRVASDLDVPVIIMEYIDGRTLADVLVADGPLPAPDVRRILAGVADALAAAHQQRIVHRDIRPSNIMRESGTGRIVLTDFGLAKILESGHGDVTQLTRPGAVLGDPDHISPEQLRGEPVTEAADIYSLGVLGYELLAGSGPYDANTPASRARAHLSNEPRRLAVLEAEDPALASLLHRCLAKKPEQRPRATDVVRTLAGGDATSAGESETRVSALHGFLGELKRRKVYRVGAAYGAAALVTLEIADTLLPSLPLPAVTQAVVVSLVLAGFPVALILAWMYDITARGIERAATPGSVAPVARFRLLLLQVLGLGLSLILAALIAWWILSGE